MGQIFGKSVKTDGVVDRSGLYGQCTAAPSDIDHHSPVRFGKLLEMHRRRAEGISALGLTLSDMEILNTPVIEGPDLADSVDRLLYGLDLDSDTVQNPVKSKSVRDEEIQPAQAHIEAAVEEDIQLTSVRLSEEKLEDSKTPSVNMEGLSDSLDRFLVRLHLDSDVVQNPVPSKSVRDEEIQPVQAHIEAAVEEDIKQSLVRLSEEKLEDSKTPSVKMEEINSCLYAVGEILAASTRAVVYVGTRVHDGLEVALKYVHTSSHLDYIRIPGHPDPLPREVALQMLACDDGNILEIVQLLDWVEYSDHYIMVLERRSPCEGLNKFVASRGGKLDEELAKRIIWQASVAANICCEQGVFHRDITLENLIINTDMNDVKLVNFGCGELLKKSTYNTFTGTREYVCPEFFKTGKYHGKPATVYSLGVLLFALLCGKFPSSNDRFFINERAWIKDYLTEKCCRLVEDCLQEDPEKRINLERICQNEWFQDDSSDDLQFPFNTGIRDQPRVLGIEINGCQYEIAGKLGQGGFGTVFKATRLHDILKVAVKFVRKGPLVKNDYISIPGYPRPFPREVGLHLLACEGEYVPVIVQLLDWQETPEHFIMVLERPSLCMDVGAFVEHHGGTVTEKIAQRILWQAAEAAEVCCKRGVFHRDIKLENLLINPDTLEVKLIDFGCGDLLKSSPYNSYMGTRSYTCPEWLQLFKYYGKPATVYSLGVLLFVLLCGKFPAVRDKFVINECTWSKEGLSQGCCRFVIDCLQEDPEKRIDLERVRFHKWFQDLDPANSRQTSVPTGKHDVVRFPLDSGSNFNGHAEIFIPHCSDNQSHTSDRQSHTSDRQSHTSDRQSHTIDSQLHTLDSQLHISESQSHTSDRQSHTSDSQLHTSDNQLHTSDSQLHTSDSQLHTSDNQLHTLDSQLHTSDSQLHISESQLHTSVNQLHTSDSQLHTSDSQLHTSDSQLHTSDNQLHTSDSQLHTSDSQLHTSDNQLHTLDSQLHTSDSQLHISESQLHTSVNQLHTSYSQLHTSDSQLHTSDSQLHTSDNQLHTLDSQLHTSDSQLHTSCSQSEEKREDDEESSMFVLVINGCQYEIGSKLGQGGFGTVYEGTRVQDGLKVAVKYVEKTKRIIQNYIYIPGYPRPFPREVGLHLLARKGDNVPLIVQLLDWQDYPEQYVMVLELPSPCEDVGAFVEHNGGTVTEVIARTIFRQAAEAAQVCCERGVFHRDIKQQNLLINPNTLEVKLIDFGCGDLLKSSAYYRYMGTKQYTCPEYAETGSYHGKPATVYSLGVLLFAIVCGECPSCLDLKQINNKKWSKDGLTAECCDFIQACLQRNPDKRIHLGEILEHAWF
ncbi:uncharacterized protein LOC130424627 isoform X2 [Triplophysa dalaica]|uniref:uncharacterized protein LOC130424627 isoform X2 n=1 Tax=Triplophysa dalaica TaxID=1582913 RepID=UPI0024DF3BD7|nr:uncharacterized protein LOC130424627 isoform X2 [Triplophysa dalaica]